tara:strand:- start:520 stop:891 length:372 start_codon:yes stop_codon:yes gene_type:complete
MELEKGIDMLNLLKQRKEEQDTYRQENDIISIRRQQINKDNPAIAQLRIEFPEAQEGFKEYFDTKVKGFGLGHVHEFTEISPTNYVIEIRSMKLMYTWFEYFIDHMKKDFSNVVVRGVWEKYD